MISPSFISDLLDRVDCYEVVNRRVPLKPKGDNGWACCPFHNEKTSSFSVSHGKQFYHCFGCGAHGNAISFLMNYEGVDYPTAIERLAAEYGMEVRYEGKSTKTAENLRLTDVLKEAEHYYQKELKSSAGQNAMKYILNRGLTDETIEKFGLGYSPDGWHNLSKALGDIEPKLLLEAGLTREGNAGAPYDFFRNRLMFPIRNQRGHTIAFSARTLTNEEPKYINTGETPVFVKGREIFGLYEARQAIFEKKRVLVVEGQMDVIQLSQAGIREVCAPLGTAIKTEHIDKLLKICDEIIFSFDGDGAGRKAARRAMELALPLLGDHQKARFLFLPEGEDPDSFMKAQGIENFEKKISEAIPLSKFMLNSLSEGLDLKISEDKATFVAAATPLVQSVRSNVFKLDIVRQIAVAVGVDETSIQKQMKVETVASVSSSVVPYQGRRDFRDGFGRGSARLRPTLPTQDEKSLLSSVLRNFIYYPQLVIQFERQLNDCSFDEQIQPLVNAVVQTAMCEYEDGFSLADAVHEMEANQDDAARERQQENIRSCFLELLRAGAYSDVFSNLDGKARLLNTPLELAKLETELVFLQLERHHIEADIKRCMELGISGDDGRRHFRLLSETRQKLRSKEAKLRTDMSAYLTKA
jgi:DNA primase